MPGMADKLLIVMMNVDPESALCVVPPLLQATAAGSMEYDVEVVLEGRAAVLALPGVAEALTVQAERGRTAHDLIREAHAAGVVFKVGSDAGGQRGSGLIPEVVDVVGAAYVVSEAMDESTVALTY